MSFLFPKYRCRHSGANIQKRSIFAEWGMWGCELCSYHRLPPKYSKVPYQIRPLPQWGTKPTRMIISGVTSIAQLPVLIVSNAYTLITMLLKVLVLLWGYVFVALKLIGRVVVDGAVNGVKKAVSGVTSGAVGAVKAVQGVAEGVAERMYADAPVEDVPVEVVEVVEEWIQAEAADAWDVPGMGSDQVVF